MATRAQPGLAPDAAMVLGIAATALPFARTSEDEAERWLWVLRLYGEGGAALQALGVSEERLEEPSEVTDGDRAVAGDGEERDVIARVTEHAVAVAARHRANVVTTTDILIAVMHIYGTDFDRVLRAHGSDSREVIERLAASEPARAED